ncbi:hypothetical protein K0651_09860 [Ornithinimicrobium sp. Arc0846-15]|nr:hypothetical protein [Ornithinimicrobium laminariae]
MAAEWAELGQGPATIGIRKDDAWRVQPPPADLVTRRVELAAPATFEDAARVAGSGADVWVADLEDSLVPTWPWLLEAHEAIADYLSEADQGQRPTLMVRPRGLHLDDVHLDVAAPIVDVGMVVARHSKALAAFGSAPYFYLPKIETHAEAIWWNDLLGAVEKAWSLPIGSIRVSVLLQTVHAAPDGRNSARPSYAGHGVDCWPL